MKLRKPFLFNLIALAALLLSTKKLVNSPRAEELGWDLVAGVGVVVLLLVVVPLLARVGKTALVRRASCAPSPPRALT